MKCELKIETLQERHLAPYAELSRTEYGDSAGVSQIPHLRWKFLQNPFGPSIGIHLYNDGELIGRIAAMPQQYRNGGKVYSGAHLVDTLVSPKHRSLRALQRLSEGIHRLPDFEFQLLTPNDQAYGFAKYLVRVPAFFDMDAAVVPLRPLKLLCTTKHLPLRWAAPAVDGCWRVLLTGAGALASATSGITVSSEWPSPDELETMLSADWEGLTVGVRTTAFLEWRFRRSPVFKYSVYFLRRFGWLVGYVATRHRVLDGYDCQFIVDAYGSPQISYRDWAKVMFNHVRRNCDGNPDAMMTFGNTTCGPLSAATRSFLRIPERLSPRKMPLFVKWRTEPVFELNKDTLCLSLADLDMV